MFDRYESELAHAFAAPRVQSTGSLQPRDALGHLSSHAQHQAVDSSHLVYSSHATLQSGISSPIPPLDPTEAHAPRAGSEVSSLRFSPLFLADRRRPALIQAPYVLPGLGPETQHSTSKSHSFSDLPDAFPASSDYPSSHHNVLTSEVSSLSFVSGPSTRLTGRYPLSATETPPPPPPPRSYEHVHHEPPSMLAPSGMQEVPSEPGAAPAPFHGDAAGEGYPVVNAFPESGARLDEPPPLMYRCHLCPKTFLSAHGFNMHQRTHTYGPKPYKCPIKSCGRTFVTRSNALRHLIGHGPDADGLNILRLSLRTISASIAAPPAAAAARARPLAMDRVLPSPSSYREPLPPASLLVPCASVTRSSRYPLLAPTPGTLTAPCPLPPVRPRLGEEERNSWDPPPTDAPYHPSGWACRSLLPGPALDEDASPASVGSLVTKGLLQLT